MTYLLLTSAASLAVFVLLLWRAPRGWQDDRGFHLGDEPYQDLDHAAQPQEEAASGRSSRQRRAA
ncbi:MAG: hypothetical protein ACKOW1_04305 [Novosphingobium sp.]